MKYWVIGDHCREGNHDLYGPFRTFQDAERYVSQGFDANDDGSCLILEWDEDVGWISIWQSAGFGNDLVAEQPGAELLRTRGVSGGVEMQPRGFRPEADWEPPV